MPLSAACLRPVLALIDSQDPMIARTAGQADDTPASDLRLWTALSN